MFKKMMLLAMAALATMAFAVPAAAFASGGAIKDTSTGLTLAEGNSVSFAGTAGFLGETGGFTGCEVSGSLKQGATASAVTASLTVTPGCSTGVGAFEGCTVEESTGSGTGTVTGHDIDVSITIEGTNNAECGAAVGHSGALEHVVLHLNLTLAPTANTNTSLDCLTVTGGGEVTTALGNGPIEAFGSVGATEAGTWVIETI